VERDEAKAVYWFERAARENDVVALQHLGVAYLQGRGVPKDEKKGAEWYERAARLGDKTSQYKLAMCYENGRGGNRSSLLASCCCVTSSDRPFGFLFARAVPKSEREAALWYLRLRLLHTVSPSACLMLSRWDVGCG
jgi:TPR repeat protein